MRAHELLSLPFAKELDLRAELGDVLGECCDDGHFEDVLRAAGSVMSGRWKAESHVTCMGILPSSLYKSSHGLLACPSRDSGDVIYIIFQSSECKYRRVSMQNYARTIYELHECTRA